MWHLVQTVELIERRRRRQLVLSGREREARAPREESVALGGPLRAWAGVCVSESMRS